MYINPGGVPDKLCPGIAGLSGPGVFFNVHVRTSEYGDGGGLASSIVAQEGSDLTLIHVQTQLIHCHLPPTSTKQSLCTAVHDVHVHANTYT